MKELNKSIYKRNNEKTFIMAQTERLDFSQPMNELGVIGEEQRKKLFPKNDYKTEKEANNKISGKRKKHDLGALWYQTW